MLLDKYGLHRGIFAKMPTASSKALRSIRVQSGSRLNRAILDA